MKGKLGLLMLVFLVGSYFLYNYKGSKRGEQDNTEVANIAGQVTDRHSGKVIVKATVEVVGTPTKVLTNDNGEYSIPAKKGDQLLVAHPKYRRMMFEITGDKEDVQLVAKDYDPNKKENDASGMQSVE